MRKKKFVSLVSIFLSISIALSNATTAFAAIEDDTNSNDTVCTEELDGKSSEPNVMSEEDARDYQIWLDKQEKLLSKYQANNNNIVLHENEDYSYSGSCGESIKYSYDIETHTLKLSGSGIMDDYSSQTPAPWCGFCSDIQYLDIEENITAIGDYAFIGCTQLTIVTIPESTTSIGNYVFSGCSSLESVNLYENIDEIGEFAFEGCSALNEIKVDGEVIKIENLQFKDKIKVLNPDAPNNETAITVSEEYSETFKYKLAIAVANNETYFDKLAYTYCHDILVSLNATEYVRELQIKMVYDWMQENFSYAFFYVKDETGDEIFNNESYSKSIPMTHNKSAHLLTGYGVCSAYSQIFQLFMDILVIPCRYIVNGGVTVVDESGKTIVGRHGWNLVEVNSNEWYYMDVTTEEFLIGQSNFKDDFYVGYRDGDRELELRLIQKLLSDIAPGKIMEDDFKDLRSYSFIVNNHLDNNFTINFPTEDIVYMKKTEISDEQSKYYIIVKDYDIPLHIKINDVIIYTIKNPKMIYYDDGICDKFKPYFIKYTVYYKNRMIWIDLTNPETAYVDLKDYAGVVSYLKVVNNEQKDNEQEERYYKSSNIFKYDDNFRFDFCDKNNMSIFGRDTFNFLEESNFVLSGDAAYYASSSLTDDGYKITFKTNLLGDIDENGSIDVDDLSILSMYLLGDYQFIQTGSMGDLSIDTKNITINGNISANGKFTINADNANINGTLSAKEFEKNISGQLNTNNNEQDNIISEDLISMVFTDEKMMSCYFNNADVVEPDSVTNKYISNTSGSTLNIGNPLVVNGDAEFDGSYNLNSSIKTSDNMTFTGNVVNSSDSVLYSQNGDILINSENVTLNGFVYAPNGKVTISSKNINITGTIIAKEIVIKGDSSMNFTVAMINTINKFVENITITNYQGFLADLTRDEKLDIFDLIRLRRKILGVI